MRKQTRSIQRRSLQYRTAVTEFNPHSNLKGNGFYVHRRNRHSTQPILLTQKLLSPPQQQVIVQAFNPTSTEPVEFIIVARPHHGFLCRLLGGCNTPWYFFFCILYLIISFSPTGGGFAGKRERFSFFSYRCQKVSMRLWVLLCGWGWITVTVAWSQVAGKIRCCFTGEICWPAVQKKRRSYLPSLSWYRSLSRGISHCCEYQIGARQQVKWQIALTGCPKIVSTYFDRRRLSHKEG